MSVLKIPDLSLVVLVGITGSGKSTFARKHFAPSQVLSSDFCRGLVSDDENDQAATPDAFALLHHIAGVRLRRGLLTVVDATNVQADARKSLVALAREHDVLPVTIVLDVPESLCAERSLARTDRGFGPDVVRRQRDQLRRSLRGLAKEGFRRVHVLASVEEIEAATIEYEKQYNDKRELPGPFDIVGDIHGCASELRTLLATLGYELRIDDAGRAVEARHPDGRTAVFVGDLVDRGPDTPGVLRLVMGMVAAGNALCVPGNHENKLVRALDGRDVRVSHGLAESLAQLDAEPVEFRSAARAFMYGLVSHYVLDGGRLVVAHAGLKEAYHGRASGRVRSFALYGETTGETDEYGLPVRYPWAREYRGRAMVVYGHTPVTQARWENNTICLDTGCVFGGSLTALRYPERELVAVPAEQVWYEPVRPLAAPTAEVGGRREDDTLDLADVSGRRVVETRHRGRITVREENAAAALEVVSRFSVDPRWLAYLPPTMSPCATSELDGLLEHPAQAFGYYAGVGVEEVVCEEKHMGSRAVVLVCRSAAVASARFGVDTGATGAAYTRTGRPFFGDSALTEALLERVRSAIERAGLWAELDTGWLLLDAELLPWSAKADGLLRDHYAAVGAAARTVLPAAVAALDAAAARGLDVSELRATTARRAANAQEFTAAYRRYRWPTSGLAGVQLAPFAVLAGEGSSYAERGHRWHLELIDRLVAADSADSADPAALIDRAGPGDPTVPADFDTRPDPLAPGLIRATHRMFVTLAEVASVAAATAWWRDLTDAGGEGIVVKPAAGLVRGSKGLV
ncbi:MAG: polynucleotide kinase-phosphatase, partial [Actinomycetota bacterium]|nr:polynucleotide kinase-phosphatase [Actinomycetota bacterium]